MGRPGCDTRGVNLAELRELLRAEDPAASRTLESVLAFESSEWVVVYRDDLEDFTGDSLLAVLLRGDELKRARTQAGYDVSPGDGRPGFVTSYTDNGSETEYLPVGSEDVVPVVHVRLYNGPFPKTVELAEDFRLCWDLYEDRTRGEWVTVDEVGGRVVVAKWAGDDLMVSKRFLRRYQAARQLHLSMQFCVDRRGGDELKHLDAINVDIDEGDVRLAYHGSDGMLGGLDPKYFTRLVGKRLIPPPPVEQSSMRPYDDPAEFESFIIGIDAEGRPVEHICDPEMLANYFGKNPGAPHFLTPVFFGREVLEKYFADPDRYEVQDGYLSAAHSFGLPIDNALTDHVMVFLGDLGRGLPHREQRYWRSYNVAPPGPISETAFRRSFLGQWADSVRIEHRFIAAYEAANKAWRERFGWHLFRPLHEADAHLLRSLRVPVNLSFSQFDDQIVRLAKIAVGALDEKQIVAATAGADKVDGGINKLERLMSQEGLDPDPLCSALRHVQGVRSRSAAHNKSREFDMSILLDGAADLRTLFTKLLEALTAQLAALAETLGAGMPPEESS